MAPNRAAPSPSVPKGFEQRNCRFATQPLGYCRQQHTARTRHVRYTHRHTAHLGCRSCFLGDGCSCAAASGILQDCSAPMHLRCLSASPILSLWLCKVHCWGSVACCVVAAGRAAHLARRGASSNASHHHARGAAEQPLPAALGAHAKQAVHSRACLQGDTCKAICLRECAVCPARVEVRLCIDVDLSAV